MAKSRTAMKTLAGEDKVLAPVQFQAQFDAWLKTNEAAKPFLKLRELEGRIATGQGKLRAAEQRGISPDDAEYKAAAAKLAGLKFERNELIKNYSVPHFALADVHNFLRATRGWNLPEGSKIEIRIPGIFVIAVDLSESEIPF